MAEYGVTDKGFVLKRFDTILSEIQADVSTELGFDVSQNPQSALNAAIILPIADRLASLWEMAQDSYYAKYPSTAEGINLDNACQYLDVKREASRRSEYSIHCKGLDGTMIPKGSFISSATNPSVNLICAKDSEIRREYCNSLTLKLLSVFAGDYIIKLNDTEYKFQVAETSTTTRIIQGLADAFTASGWSKVISEDGKFLTLKADSDAESGTFELSPNITTVDVTSIVEFVTEEYGSFELPNGTIRNIVSTIAGLDEVENKITPTLGRDEQTDWELRQIYAAKASNTAITTTESISAHILDSVMNVEKVITFENDMDTQDSEGRPPHSIEVVVDGGEDSSIARAILEKKPGGIQTFGSSVVDVTGTYGDVIPIRFNRPERVYAWIQVKIQTDGGNLPLNYRTIVQNEIIESTQDMSIGDNFITQQYIQKIYEDISGTQFVIIKVATSENAETVPETFVEGNIEISNRQVIDFNAERIEVTTV